MVQVVRISRKFVSFFWCVCCSAASLLSHLLALLGQIGNIRAHERRYSDNTATTQNIHSGFGVEPRTVDSGRMRQQTVRPTVRTNASGMCVMCVVRGDSRWIAYVRLKCAPTDRPDPTNAMSKMGTIDAMSLRL